MENCTLKSELAGDSCAEMLMNVGDALYVIGGKWKLRVIIALYNGAKRFNELQRTVTGISARLLAVELKQLELNGFVIRKVNTDVAPVLIEYEITDYCKTLAEVVNSLNQWGKMHRNNIKNNMI